MAVVGCCWLLLVAAVVFDCQWLLQLLLVAVVVGWLLCCWLLCGCWLVVMLLVALWLLVGCYVVGCCGCWLVVVLLVAVVVGWLLCCWLLWLLVVSRARPSHPRDCWSVVLLLVATGGRTQPRKLELLARRAALPRRSQNVVKSRGERVRDSLGYPDPSKIVRGSGR